MTTTSTLQRVSRGLCATILLAGSTLNALAGEHEARRSAQAGQDQAAQAPAAQDAEQATGPEMSRASDDLPMPDEIFERYIEALGGWDKLRAIKNRRIMGTFEGDPFEFKAGVKIWWEADNRYHLNIKEPAGLFYDLYAVDDMAWSIVYGGEPQAIGGVQRLEILDTAEFFGEAAYKTRYKTMETQAEATAGEIAVYVVRATTHGGRPHTLYFAKDTGLLIGDRVPDSGPEGKMRVMTVRIEGYKEIEGTLYPTRFIQTFSDNSRPNTMIFTRIEINTDDEHDYTVPPAILDVYEQAKRNGELDAGTDG